MVGPTKEAIERETAELFLSIYNANVESPFWIVSQPEPPAPDVHCENTSGTSLNLEVTLLQDREADKETGRKGDAAVFMGRSDERDWRKRFAELERVKRGEISVFETITTSGDILGNALTRIADKLTKQYSGTNIALLLRSTSGVDWDWEDYIETLRAALALFMQEQKIEQHHFDRGIWIVAKEEAGIQVYPVDEGRVHR